MIQKSEQKDIHHLLACYDDANMLFDQVYRADGTEEIIESLLNQNDVYHFIVQGEIVAFIGFSEINDYTVLNALYVKRQYQGKKISDQLLDYMEGKIKCKQIFVTYLNMALWAGKYYKKKGFVEVEDLEGSLKAYYDSKVRPYSTTLIKEVEC